MAMMVPVCLDSVPVFNWIKTLCPFGQPSSFITVIAEKEWNARERNVTFRMKTVTCYFALHVAWSCT